MNRIITAIRPRTCQHCEALAETQRALDRKGAEAEEIEIATGETVEFWVPSAERYLRPSDSDSDDNDQGIRMMLGVEARLCSLSENLTAFTVTELRRISGELSAAADRLEGSVQ